MKTLSQEQKDYIREADNAIIELEEQLQKINNSDFYKGGVFSDEQQEAQEKAIHTIKDFITWSLNNIRE